MNTEITEFERVQFGTDGKLYRYEAIERPNGETMHQWHEIPLIQLAPPTAQPQRGEWMLPGPVGKIRITVEFEGESPA